MASIDSYIDRVCARLHANPAAVEDIRREIRLHLEDMIEEYCAGGMSRPEAAERAITRLGQAEQIRTGLDSVYCGDAEWMRRLKGMAVGGLLGPTLSLLFRLAGHGAASDVLLGTASGACIGLFSTSRAPLVAGLAIGSLTWFAARIGSLAASLASNSGERFPLEAAHSVLLSLVVGGVFGVVVAAGAAALLPLLSRSRSAPG